MFNQAAHRPKARLKHRLGQQAGALFPSEGPIDRLARELAERKAIDLKEFLESVEFYGRVRRRVRATQMADLCCGHGLTGLLFALLEPSVERVVLVDERCPNSFEPILDGVAAIGPWVRDKIEYRQESVQGMAARLEPGTSVIGVHACGIRTDRCMDVGIALQVPMAVMPCCYSESGQTGPPGIREVLGLDLAWDIERTYRLRAAGYRVDWSAIPAAVSPMNRILVAWKPLEHVRLRGSPQA